MFVMQKYTAVASLAVFLDNIKTDAAAQGWTVDKYTAGDNGELYLHNVAGRYFSMKLVPGSDPSDAAWANLRVHGNTGFNAGSAWDAQPGRFSMEPEPWDSGWNQNMADGTGYRELPNHSVSHYRQGIMNGYWVKGGGDMWTFADADNIMVFYQDSDYAWADLGTSTLCPALIIGQIDRYNPTGGGTNGGAIVFSDLIGFHLDYQKYFTYQAWPSVTRLWRAWPHRADWRVRFSTSYTSYVRFRPGGNFGLFWNQGIADEAKISLSAWNCLEGVGTVDTNYDGSYYMHCYESMDQSYRHLDFTKMVQFNGAMNRAILQPLIMVVSEEVDSVAYNYPVGEMPYYALNHSRPIEPGEELTVGTRHFTCFPLLMTGREVGVAVRTA